MNEQSLHDNLQFVQEKIDLIKKKKVIDIKDISDLQRYSEMLRNFLTSIQIFHKIGERK